MCLCEPKYLETKERVCVWLSSTADLGSAFFFLTGIAPKACAINYILFKGYGCISGNWMQKLFSCSSDESLTGKLALAFGELHYFTQIEGLLQTDGLSHSGLTDWLTVQELQYSFLFFYYYFNYLSLGVYESKTCQLLLWLSSKYKSF